MSTPPHIVVVGAGGVGCWLAALLATASQTNPKLARVSFVARGWAFERLRADGLRFTVKEPSGNPMQTFNVAPAQLNAAPTCAALAERGDKADYVILGVKTWQVAEAAKDAALVLREGSGCIVTTQNGVSAPLDVKSACGDDVGLLTGVAKIIAYRDDASDGPLNACRLAGEVPSSLIVGETEPSADATPSERTARLRAILSEAGVTTPVPEEENMQRELWRKAVMMCSMGPLCAVARADIYTVTKTPSTLEMLRAAMNEVCELSKHFPGCYVGDGQADKTIGYLTSKLSPGGSPSTCRDVICGRPSEVRELSGTLVRLGKEKGVPTPVHAFMSATLEPQEAMARGEHVYSIHGVPGGKPFVTPPKL